MLAQILPELRELEELDLSGTGIGLKGSLVLASALGSLEHLETAVPPNLQGMTLGQLREFNSTCAADGKLEKILELCEGNTSHKAKFRPVERPCHKDLRLVADYCVQLMRNYSSSNKGKGPVRIRGARTRRRGVCRVLIV